MMNESTPQSPKHENRDLLIRDYNITYDFATQAYIDIPADDLMNLIRATISQAAFALLEYGKSDYFSSDDIDYMNAIRDQINWLTNFMIDDRRTDADRRERFLNLINYSEQDRDLGLDDDDPDYDAECWVYGYADHYTPISELLIANHDDDDDITE